MTQPDLKTRLADSPEEARELNEAFALAIKWTKDISPGNKGMLPNYRAWDWHTPAGDFCHPDNLPNFIGSIDAALATVQAVDGWELRSINLWDASRKHHPTPFIRLSKIETTSGEEICVLINGTDIPAIARAICIAILEIDNATS